MKINSQIIIEKSTFHLLPVVLNNLSERSFLNNCSQLDFIQIHSFINEAFEHLKWHVIKISLFTKLKKEINCKLKFLLKVRISVELRK